MQPGNPKGSSAYFNLEGYFEKLVINLEIT